MTVNYLAASILIPIIIVVIAILLILLAYNSVDDNGEVYHSSVYLGFICLGFFFLTLVLFIIIIYLFVALGDKKTEIIVNCIYASLLILSIILIVFCSVILTYPWNNTTKDKTITVSASKKTMFTEGAAGTMSDFTSMILLRLQNKTFPTELVNFYPLKKKNENNNIIKKNFRCFRLQSHVAQILRFVLNGMPPPFTGDIIIDKTRRDNFVNEAFNEFHKNYTFDEKFLNELNKEIEIENGTVGVHVRYTGHNQREDLTIEQHIQNYFKTISQNVKDDKKLFLATHLKQVEDEFKKKYPKIKMLKQYRNPKNNVDWEQNDLTEIEERINVFRDVICLSRCESIICGPSNVIFAACVLNPKLKIIFVPGLDIHKPR